MLSSKSSFLNQRVSCSRYLSFFERFCKKDSNDSNDGGPNVDIQLEKAFKIYNLEDEPKSTVCINRKMALKLHREMQFIRRMEHTANILYKEKVIRGFCHLYTGQEACCVGIKSIMRPQDTSITSYRAHGWTWLMGTSVYAILAELCQKQTGCNRGKGGSMHTYAPNFFGGNGIVGSQTPLGAGVAFAHAYRCDGGVSFTCYGDGAANQGQLHESFNIACLWKLPVIFVCENNKYGMGTHIKRSSCSTDYYTRGDYIPGVWVDGNNVLAVKSAAEFVRNHALTCGPILMELETYRYFGHSMSDPGTSYRKREEVQTMRDKFDPITRFKQLCVKNNLIKEEEYKKIDEAIKKEIADAAAQARKDKESDINELGLDIYSNNLGGNTRNVVRRNLKHGNVGVRLVPVGVVKPTPMSEIKLVPKETKVAEKPSPKGDLKKDNLADQKSKKGASEQKVKDNKPAKKETTDKPKNIQDPKKK